MEVAHTKTVAIAQGHHFRPIIGHDLWGILMPAVTYSDALTFITAYELHSNDI